MASSWIAALSPTTGRIFGFNNGSPDLKLPSGATFELKDSSESNTLLSVDESTGAVSLGKVDANTTIAGNLVVDGTTTTVESETVLLSDNHLLLNSGYSTVSAQTGGLVVNYLPTATADDTVGAGVFTAGVDESSDPTVTTQGSGTFSATDLIQISDSANNDGLYEVQGHSGTTLTIKSTANGITNQVEDFTQDQFVAETDTGATITKITVSVIRAGTDGSWEAGSGSTTGISFTNLSTVGSDGWTDDGTTVRLTTATDEVAIGTATASGKLTVRNDTGDAQNLLTLEKFDGTDMVTVSGAGLATFVGNVDATGGLDVTTAALTAAAGLTLTNTGITMTGLDLGAPGAEIGNIYQGSYIRMGKEGSAPDHVTDKGFVYVMDDGGDTELFYTDAAGNDLQITKDGALNITATLDDAYNGGRTVTVDSGPIVLNTSTTVGGALDINPSLTTETAAQIDISWAAGDYTGTPYGIVVDYSGMTSLNNAGHVYGAHLIGVTNAGAGFTFGLNIDGAWDAAMAVAGGKRIFLNGTSTALTGYLVYGEETTTTELNTSGSDNANDIITKIAAKNAGSQFGIVELEADTTIFSVKDDGSIFETGAVSIDLTPSGALTLRGGGASQFGDDIAYWAFDGVGSVTETGMTLFSLTPSGDLTIRGGGPSKFGDDVGIWDFDGAGAVSETGMTTFSLTPSGTLTIQGGGVSKFGDDVGTWDFDGAGAVSETGMTSLSVTPSGAITLTAGAASVWSTSAGALTITSAAAATWSTAAGDLTLDAAGDIKIGTNLIPDADQTHDLGSATATWDDLYLGGGWVLSNNTIATTTAAANDLAYLSGGDTWAAASNALYGAGPYGVCIDATNHAVKREGVATVQVESGGTNASKGDTLYLSDTAGDVVVFADLGAGDDIVQVGVALAAITTGNTGLMLIHMTDPVPSA